MNIIKIILLVFLGFLAILQIESNGMPIYDNIFHHKNIDNVSSMQWLNFMLGLISAIFMLFVFPFLKKALTISLIALTLITLNMGFIFLHFYMFFSSPLLSPR